MRSIVWLILLFFSMCITDLKAQVNLIDRLVAYFPFSGDANDASGNALHGAVVNAQLTADRSGQLNKAYQFNGATSYIQLPYSNLYNFPPAGAFSIAAWIQPATDNTSFGAIFVKSPAHPDFLLSVWNYGAYIYDLKAMHGRHTQTVGAATTVFQNSPCWYHVVWAYDDGRWYIYVNGKLEFSDLTRTVFILQDGSSKLVMGKKGESSGNFYKGKLDELRLYSRVLTQAEINILADPVVHPYVADTTVCRNTSFEANATGANTYQWTPATGLSATNVANPVITVSSTTRYIVTGRSVTGCAANDTVDIVVAPLPVTTKTKDTVICAESTGVQLLVSGGTGYRWSPPVPASDMSIPNPLVKPSGNTKYYVDIQYGPGCTVKDSIKIDVYPKTPLAVSPQNSSICKGLEVTLTASGAVIYSWSPGATLKNANTASPVAAPLVSTTYYVTAKDINNCESTDSARVQVTDGITGNLFLVPNAFTPNNDRLNDCFGVSHWTNIASFQLKVFNRWGQVVFSTTDHKKCWDGRYSTGEQATPGNYIYTISAKSACGDLTRAGDVRLIR